MAGKAKMKPGHCGYMYARISRGMAGPTAQNELLVALNKDQATVYKGDPGTGPLTKESLAKALAEAPNHTLVFYRASNSLRPFPNTKKVCTKNEYRIEYGEAKDPLAARSKYRRTKFMLKDSDTASQAMLVTATAQASPVLAPVQIEECCTLPKTVADWQKLPQPERRFQLGLLTESLKEDARLGLLKDLSTSVQTLPFDKLQEVWAKVSSMTTA